MLRTIPNTDGRYSLTESGEVINNANGREVVPFRPGSVKIIISGKRTTVQVAKLIEATKNVAPEIATPEQRFAVLEARLNDTIGEIKKLFREKR